MNNKVKNAKSIETLNIHFKSFLEKRVYDVLKEYDIEPQYEAHKYVLFKDFKPRIPLFCLTDKHLSYSKKKILPITYTPDFTFVYKDLFVIIEVKGFPNDVFPYKFKMFRHLLEDLSKTETTYKYVLVEIFNTEQLKEFIKILTSYDPMHLNLNLQDLESCIEDPSVFKSLVKLYDTKKYEDLEIALRKAQRSLAKNIKAVGGNAWKDPRYTKMHELINSVALYTIRDQLLTENSDSFTDTDD